MEAGLFWKHFPTPLEPSVVIGTFRVGAKPACCANEAVRGARTTSSAKADFTKVFDMGESFHNEIRQNAGLYWLEFPDTIKLKLNATHGRYARLVNVISSPKKREITPYVWASG